MNIIDFKNIDNRWFILRAKVYEERVKSAFLYFRKNNIEPILIKGWAAAIEYPESFQRIFGDIDLCVKPELYKKGRLLVESEEGKSLAVDLHCGLRHLDKLEWDDLYEKSILIELDQVQIRILCPEDHLRVLCVHWLNDGGADKERLLDIYHLLQNHYKDFDWNKCFRQISSVRKDWIIKTISIVARYYELDISVLPFSKSEIYLPKWMIKTLENEWSSGTRLIPIHLTLKNQRQLWQQIKKRIPPNAIQSTVELEGKFDNSRRFYYQAGSMVKRFPQLINRIFNFESYRKK